MIRNNIYIEKPNRLLGFGMLMCFLIFTGCKNNCSSIPSTFSSFKEAKRAVRNSRFDIEENINTRKSSWIESASYMSCDERTGYLILETSSKDYIGLVEKV